MVPGSVHHHLTPGAPGLPGEHDRHARAPGLDPVTRTDAGGCRRACVTGTEEARQALQARLEPAVL